MQTDMNKYNLSIYAAFIGAALLTSCANKSDSHSVSKNSGIVDINVNAKGIDFDFITTLSAAGIFRAANEIGLDADAYLSPLGDITNHPYRRYRWSVGYHANGGVMISALPPEEEMGWTPWERWYKDSTGIVRKESWVLYPLKNPTASGIALWYRIEEDGLAPLFLNKPSSLEDQLSRARIYEAAKVLGFDANEVLIKPLTEKGRKYYEQCRWVVVPHILGVDGPVIYILPPMNHSDEWPWESWYSDGKTALIHHPHFTKKTPETTQQWREYPGAPQRPPEIFGVDWYWYNDPSLKPTMANL